MEKKASVEEIKVRFDNDVDRFTNLQTGQVSVVDAPIMLDVVTEVAKRIRPEATDMLDLGCGGGNYAAKMVTRMPNLNCTLIDLSDAMLVKAKERVESITSGNVLVQQGDMREVTLGEDQFDFIFAGATLHHLREDHEWELVFTKLYKSLKKGGCFFVADLIEHENELLNQYFKECYIDYLSVIGGREYAEEILGLIEKADTPRSIVFQTDLLKKIGFRQIEILHKNICYAAFYAVK